MCVRAANHALRSTSGRATRPFFGFLVSACRFVQRLQPLEFHTPYGCSKGAADQYVLDYARSFGVPTAVLRMSCIYGQRQMGTEDQGWVAHFLIHALEGKPITLYGDGHQVRDILDVHNAVEAYLAAWRRIERVAGSAFNLGGGPHNAVSLKTLLAYIAEVTAKRPDIHFADWRAGDQRYFVADTRSARALSSASSAVTSAASGAPSVLSSH